eukprot:1141245-Pelagomonas_calceolata.AAC.4
MVSLSDQWDVRLYSFYSLFHAGPPQCPASHPSPHRPQPCLCASHTGSAPAPTSGRQPCLPAELHAGRLASGTAGGGRAAGICSSAAGGHHPTAAAAGAAARLGPAATATPVTAAAAAA